MTETRKLHKVLADLGYGSRRELERWIAAGRVTVNGEPAHPGQRVADADAIAVNGRKLAARASGPARVIVLNKPDGAVCTRKDPEGRRTVFEGLPRLRRGRWISVGRLDVQTSGLLALTSDGALAHRMMHPSTGLDREYAVRVDGRLGKGAEQALREGVVVDGARCRFSDLRHYAGAGRNHWYHVVLMEGRNRQVRQLFEAAGHRVTRLKRVRFGPILLPPGLRRGQFREMESRDLARLYRLLGLPFAPPRGKERPARQSQSLLLPYPPLPHLQGSAPPERRGKGRLSRR